ncbi:hypothetical protein [Dictyobacter kobayashii]|uniref:MAM domain-containing protein n=1 Tax=Dictyobacter kobayashii TaxID=2014872 RepID=A0A402AV84_9CHLR|nr:hypothetical protein [Dictyobacter kobayashii]GCE23022.1 hypothetical protein KDK_68220 [Dictyobacter kobayashii]
MRRRVILALVAVLLVALVGIGSIYGVIPFTQQVQGEKHQPAPIKDTDTDQETLNKNPLSTSGSCGVERWAVKTGTDADVGKINLQSVTQTTIATLSALTIPGSLPSNNRIQPTETTVFQLHDTLTQYKLESDSDYHLIVADGSGNTMIVEIPDPACVGASSPLLPSIKKARAAFDARYTPNDTFQSANVPVTVTGVGFFDFLHGQAGVAPNGIELHAILDIQFGSGGTPTPTPTGATPTPTPIGATPTPTPIGVTPTPTPIGMTPTATPTSGNLIQNGGFETSGNWTYTGTTLPTRSTTRAHSGTYSLRVGATSNQQGDSIATQMVSIPSSSTSAALSFYYWPTTNDTSPYSWQETDIVNSSGQVIQQLFQKTTNDRAWVYMNFDLSSYAGQTIGIRFLDHESAGSGSYYGYMYVDDVTLSVN